MLKLFAIGNFAGLHQLSENSVVGFSVTKVFIGFKLGALVNHINPDTGVGFLLLNLFFGVFVVIGVLVDATDSSLEFVLVLVVSVFSGGLLVVV